MYFQIKSNILFRNYDTFGYITDNRDYSYKKIRDNNPVIGDLIVSETGALFLSVLSQQPKEMVDLVYDIMKLIPSLTFDEIYNDAFAFYNQLEKYGFLVSGNNWEECIQNDNLQKSTNTEQSINSLVDLKNESLVNTQDFFKSIFGDKPLLRSIHIDLTSVCNERCIHCYIPHENKLHHMDFSLFKKILDESIEMKVLNYTITGGEPLLHPNFLEIIKLCRKSNISLNILSNLTLLNNEIFSEFINNPLISVQASLYSIDPDIHDEITKVKGSCNLTKKAIIRLVENNVNVQISCPIIKQNVKCYLDVIEWAKAMNINVSSDYNLLGSYNSNKNNLKCRLEHKEVSEILNNLNDEDIIKIQKEVEENKLITIDDTICSVCRYSFCISENGDVYPCAAWKSFVLGNLYKSRLSDIWYESDKINYLRKLKLKDFKICSSCDDRAYCSICMAKNANENKSNNPMIVSEYHCEIARLKRKVLEKMTL